MLFSSQAYLAALNALLAEHDLGLIELVPENPFAAELRQGLISAFRVGTPTRFDEKSWIGRFNSASRIVQLNFVALGFNELGLRPMLSGESWQPVQNPLVIRDIESKVDKASQSLANRHGVTICLRSSKLSITQWGLADLSERPAPDSTDAGSSPSILFISELPQPNTPMDVIRLDDPSVDLLYYENVKTLGGEVLGNPSLYKYPQVAVVTSKKDETLLIVRIEESALGTSMLCTIEPSGDRSNLGLYSRTDRSTFIKKVVEIVSKLTNAQKTESAQ
jgi:hypothetical protein